MAMAATSLVIRGPGGLQVFKDETERQQQPLQSMASDIQNLARDARSVHRRIDQNLG